MNDVYLLMFGCGVSFIVVAAAYIHVRRFVTSEPLRVRIADNPEPVAAHKKRDLD